MSIGCSSVVLYPVSTLLTPKPLGWILLSFTGEIMCASRKFFRVGPPPTAYLYLYCFSWWGEKGKRMKLPLKTDYHRPASETPFKWRFAGGRMMAHHRMLANVGQNISGQNIPCHFLPPRTKHPASICHPRQNIPCCFCLPGHNIPCCFCHPGHNIPCHFCHPGQNIPHSV